MWLADELDMAIRECRADVVHSFLMAGHDPRATDGNGRSAVRIAAKCGHTQIVSMLLQHGADPNVSCFDSELPLYYAVAHDDASMVRALLDHGANPSKGADDERGDEDMHYAPLHSARSVAVARMLTDAGASLQTRMPPVGQTPIEVHIDKGNASIVRLLLEADADVDADVAAAAQELLRANGDVEEGSDNDDSDDSDVDGMVES